MLHHDVCPHDDQKCPPKKDRKDWWHHRKKDAVDECRRVEERDVLFTERGAAAVGDLVAIVIEGDGVNGVFVGRLVEVDPCFVRLVLTMAVGPIPAGTLVTILVEEIAAVARLPGS